MRRPPSRCLSAAIWLSLLLAACGSGGPEPQAQSRVGTPARISHIHGLAVDATGALFVATHHGLLKRATGGRFVYASADTNDHMGFSLHPEDGVMYRSGHSPSKPSLGVESSTDGATWTHASDVADPPVDFHAMAVSFADSRSLWGWDSGGRGTFRSVDGGKTWSRLEMRGIERQIFGLAATAAANVVLAATESGLSRSSDGGTTWQRVDGVVDGWVLAIAADPDDAGHILAFTQQGMKETKDGGKSWQPAGAGIPRGVEIASIAISPIDPKTAYAADAANLYETTDRGASWTPVAVG